MKDNLCPKTGKVCAKDRTYVITEVLGDGTSATALCCRQCAASYIEQRNDQAAIKDHPLMPSALEFLNSFLTDLTGYAPGTPQKITIEGVVAPKPNQVPHCPGCGATIYDILGSGRVGCAKCYDFFDKEFRSIVPEAQYGAAQHDGKKKKEPVPLEKLQMDIEYNEFVLAQMIEEENYEEAGRIRDKLKKLKARLQDYHEGDY